VLEKKQILCPTNRHFRDSDNPSKSKIRTPNIDRIAKEGFRFLDAHSGSSRCGPSRYALMTGRYSLEKSKNRILRPGTPHLGELFKSAGYLTCIIGKADFKNKFIKFFTKIAISDDLTK